MSYDTEEAVMSRSCSGPAVLAFGLLVLLPCVGCLPAPADEEQKTAAVLEGFVGDVMAAGLKRDDGLQSRFYLQLDWKDPPPSLLARLKNLPAPVLPASQCPAFQVGVQTGDVVIRVDRLEWLSASRVVVWQKVMYHLGVVEKCGTANPSTSVCKGGKWVSEPWREDR